MPQPGDRDSQWIRGFRTRHEDAPLRLLCFPHAGGSATYYSPLANRIGPAADVRAVQYPGRQDRRSEAPARSIDELADRVVAELKPWTDRPLAFFGHSMGAVVAYEVARRLEERTGTAPIGLMVSGRRAPSVVVGERVHLRDDAGLIADVRELTGTDDGLLDDEEVVRMILPALRADYTAAETYRHRAGPEPRCPIAALVGEDDSRALQDHVRAWARHTTGTFDLHVFPGGHFYLGDQWEAVGDRVRACLTAFAWNHSGRRDIAPIP